MLYLRGVSNVCSMKNQQKKIVLQEQKNRYKWSLNSTNIFEFPHEVSALCQLWLVMATVGASSREHKRGAGAKPRIFPQKRRNSVRNMWLCTRRKCFCTVNAHKQTPLNTHTYKHPSNVPTVVSFRAAFHTSLTRKKNTHSANHMEFTQLFVYKLHVHTYVHICNHIYLRLNMLLCYS